MNNKDLVRYFYEEVITNNQADKIKDYISDDSVVCLSKDRYPLGVKGMIDHLAATKQTYPDYSMEIIKQYQDGDYIISEFIMTGTHEGEWIGITPTHKTLKFNGVDIDKVVDGKIVEHGGAVNTFDTLFEAGMIKPV